MTIRISRGLAIVFAVVTATAETIRRVYQFAVPALRGRVANSASPYGLSVWPFWLDDYLLAAFLLYAAWKTGRDTNAGRLLLAAAWAFACGLFYPSFFTQLNVLSQPYAGPVPGTGVAVLKGIGLATTVFGLVATLRHAPVQAKARAANAAMANPGEADRELDLRRTKNVRESGL